MNTYIRLLLIFATTFSGGIVIAANAPAAKAAPRTATRPLAAIKLGNPRGIAVDRAGNVYVGDIEPGSLHKISPRGDASPVTIAPFTAAFGVAVDRSGGVYATDADGNEVYTVTPTGAAAVAQGGSGSFGGPTSIAVDSKGNIYVTETANALVRKISPNGTLSILAGAQGEMEQKDGPGMTARFTQPRGIAVDGADNLYVADEGTSTIRKITPDGTVSTLAGAGLPGTQDGTGKSARFGSPRGLAADAAGNVFVADTDNHTIRKITPQGVVTTFAGRAGDSGKVDGPAMTARFSGPRAIAVDGAGNLFVADSDNGAVRQITPDGTVTTIAGTKP